MRVAFLKKTSKNISRGECSTTIDSVGILNWADKDLSEQSFSIICHVILTEYNI